MSSRTDKDLNKGGKKDVKQTENLNQNQTMLGVKNLYFYVNPSLIHAVEAKKLTHFFTKCLSFYKIIIP